MDITVQPPSFAVDLGESVRETEAHRLRTRKAGAAPPSAPAQESLVRAEPSAVDQQAGTAEAEEGDFGDFAGAASAGWAGSNGRSWHVNGSSGHQGYSNGDNDLLGAHNRVAELAQHVKGLRSAPGVHLESTSTSKQHTAALSNGAAQQTTACTHTDKDDDDDDYFGAFADASSCSAMEQPEGLSNGHLPQERPAHSVPASHLETVWPGQSAPLKHAGAQQHARAPSLDSSASMSSGTGPQQNGFANFGLFAGAPEQGAHGLKVLSSHKQLWLQWLTDCTQEGSESAEALELRCRIVA